MDTDKILAMLAMTGTLKFSTATEDIHTTFHELKGAFPDLFGDLRFANNDIFPYSEELSEAFFAMTLCDAIYTTSPDYKYYYMAEKTRDVIIRDVVPTLPKEFIESIPRMAPFK